MCPPGRCQKGQRCRDCLPPASLTASTATRPHVEAVRAGSCEQSASGPAQLVGRNEHRIPGLQTPGTSACPHRARVAVHSGRQRSTQRTRGSLS